MTTLLRPFSGARRLDLLVGGLLCLVVLTVTVVDPRGGGLLLVVAAVGIVVGLLGLLSPVAAVLLLLVGSFAHEAISGLPADPLLLGSCLVVGSVVFALISRRAVLPRLGVGDGLAALYVLWNLVSVLMAHTYPGTDELRFLLKGTLIPLGLYFVGRFVFDRERPVRVLLWMVSAFTVYSTATAILQFHGPAALVWPRFIITDPGWTGRAVGIFNQPVVNGVLLVIGFLVLIYLAQDASLPRWSRAGLYVGAAATAYAVQLTHTRSALLSLVAVVVLGALFARTWRAPFVVTLVLGAAALAVKWQEFVSADRQSGGVGSSDEIVDRFNLAATALRAIAEHPVFGVGLTRFVYYNTDYHVSWSPDLLWSRGFRNVAHENELGIGAELGLVGLALWLGVLVVVIVKLVTAFAKLPAPGAMGRKFAFLGVAGMLVWLINGATVDMRFLDFANALPWLLAGIAVGVHERWVAHGRLTLDDPPPAEPVPVPAAPLRHREPVP